MQCAQASTHRSTATCASNVACIAVQKHHTNVFPAPDTMRSHLAILALLAASGVLMAQHAHAGRLAEPLASLLPLRDGAASGDSGDDAPTEPLPVVLWHGMGDSCCSMGSLGAIKKLLEDKLGVFVHSIATGSGEYGDIWSSFFGNVNDQVDKVCRELADMDELAGGFNMVGFSQGGQFLRAVVERCGHKLPRVHNLITLGGQHQGVANTPGCTTEHMSVCSAMQLLLARGAYAPYVRENVVQAQYFKDPFALEQYLASNIFLPDINNEHADKNSRYADNMAALQRFVMIRFDADTTVVPRDSAWFSFWDGKDTIPLFEQPLFKEDWIGLKRLHEAGGLLFESAPGEHMQFSLAWFEKHVMNKHLAAPGGDEPDAPAAADDN